MPPVAAGDICCECGTNIIAIPKGSINNNSEKIRKLLL